MSARKRQEKKTGKTAVAVATKINTRNLKKISTFDDFQNSKKEKTKNYKKYTKREDHSSSPLNSYGCK